MRKENTIQLPHIFTYQMTITELQLSLFRSVGFAILHSGVVSLISSRFDSDGLHKLLLVLIL